MPQTLRDEPPHGASASFGENHLMFRAVVAYQDGADGSSRIIHLLTAGLVEV